MLSELPSDNQKAATTSLLWDAVGEGGVLIAIDNGSSYRSHTIRSLRQVILDNFEDAEMIAPCRHRGRCPLKEGFSCSFSQKFMSGIPSMFFAMKCCICSNPFGS